MRNYFQILSAASSSFHTTRLMQVPIECIMSKFSCVGTNAIDAVMAVTSVVKHCPCCESVVPIRHCFVNV